MEYKIDTARCKEIASTIEIYLNKKAVIKESLLKLTRELIKLSGKVITDIHSNRIQSSNEQLIKAKEILVRILALLAEDPGFSDTGYVLLALQEYSEAQILYSLTVDNKFPSYEELKVTPQAYLLGTADLIGELRRHILENLIVDDVEKAKDFYSIMKEIYGIFLQIEVDKNLINDFRRKKDTARVLLEKTLSDLFIAIQSKRLEEKLQKNLVETDN